MKALTLGRVGWFCLWMVVGALLWWAFIQVFYFLRAVVVLYFLAHGGHFS